MTESTFWMLQLEDEEHQAGIGVGGCVEGEEKKAVIDVTANYDGQAAAVKLDRDEFEQVLHAMLQLQTYLGWD